MNEIQRVLSETDPFDLPIVGHGFKEYNRDYQIDVEIPGTGNETRSIAYLFRGCVEARYEYLAPAPISMDDTFIDWSRWQAAGSPDGYVWGVNYALGYPGWAYVKQSERAAQWEKLAGIPMHEVTIETNVYRISLVFHDLDVTRSTEGSEI